MKFNIERLQGNNIIKVALLFFWGLVVTLAAFAYARYSGHGYVYLLFSIVSNVLLYFGFRKNAIFFDTFIGVFFWLGFWVKLSVRIVFSKGVFTLTYYFDGTSAAFDRGLLVAACGLSGLVFASFIREKFFFNYTEKITDIQQEGLYGLYRRHRKLTWILFGSLFIFIGVTNAYLGIYQRGTLPLTILPFGLNGVYTWLLMFGMASISTLILMFEFEINKKASLIVVTLSLLESFVSNTSMLSRGMMLSSGALLYGLASSLKKYSIEINFRSLIITLLLFVALFIGSVLTVNYLRLSIFQNRSEVAEVAEVAEVGVSKSEVKGMTTPLFIDRWLGIEEVLAVSSYPKLGWNLWNEAWRENTTAINEKTHFYDRIFTKVSQIDIDRTKYHFIATLPGVVAFFFYPGSYFFLFFSMLFLGGLAASIEYTTYKLCGMNVIFGAFIAQVLAFRFANFGYVPSHSYLLLGAIMLNVFIIFFAEKIITAYNKRKLLVG